MVLQSLRIRAGSGSVSCIRSTHPVPQSYHIDAYPLPRRVQFGVDVSIQVDVAFRLRCALRIRVRFFDNVVVVDVPATYEIVDVFQSPVVCHFVYRWYGVYNNLYDDIAEDDAARAHVNSDITLLSTWMAVLGKRAANGLWTTTRVRRNYSYRWLWR